MPSVTTIEASNYYDSVVLMRVASQLKKEAGVIEVALFMGTQGNHELLNQVGLATVESRLAGPGDLIIIVKAESENLAKKISSSAVQMLVAGKETDHTTLDYHPRTLDRAMDYLPDATVAAISIPGEFASREAFRCLNKNLNVFLFSDNVSLSDELKLKKRALENGLLCMGPDCGTTYLNGAGLGFSNKVKRGSVGCVAASGTGLQAVMCRLDQLGEGVSHAIGVGGRDLSKEIGGIMTHHVLQMLDQDPRTDIIILVSKPPHPEVHETLNETIKGIQTPVIAYFQGTWMPTTAAAQAETLDGAADLAVSYLKQYQFADQLFEDPHQVRTLLKNAGHSDAGKRVIGLYAGGTLAKEAQTLIRAMVGNVSEVIDEQECHIITDLGDDQYTVGKPHPMIAPENRTEILLKMAENGALEKCGALLFDLVLGYGSHDDPSAELVTSLGLLKKRFGISVPVVVAIIGTEDDPQSLSRQMNTLKEFGAVVFRKNSEAARFAAMVADPARCADIVEKIT